MRILVVEDEIKLANSLKKVLLSERYVVDVCYDGQEGYEQAGAEEYDLVILDLNLPSMDGLEICKRLRDEEMATPILMLTARDTVKDKIAGLDYGADDYLIKPFEVDELMARIRALLRRRVKSKPVLEVRDLSLDPRGHVVLRAGSEINLSAKEYSLLEYMMRRPNQIISKTDLLDHVWGGEVDPFSNVVDVYIGYVRKKIDKAFLKSPPLVHTIKGMGYRLGNKAS